MVLKFDVLVNFGRALVEGSKGVRVLPELHRTGDLSVREAERSDIGMLGRPWNRDWAHPHRELTDRTVRKRIESMHLHDHQRRRECFQDSRLKMEV